jgi:hypothetical protein
MVADPETVIGEADPETVSSLNLLPGVELETGEL